jgi:hypothetical protein
MAQVCFLPADTASHPEVFAPEGYAVAGSRVWSLRGTVAWPCLRGGGAGVVNEAQHCKSHWEGLLDRQVE